MRCWEELSYRRPYTSHTVSVSYRTHVRAYTRTPLRRHLSVYHWELAICFKNGSGGKTVAKQYGEGKAQHTHADAEAFDSRNSYMSKWSSVEIAA